MSRLALKQRLRHLEKDRETIRVRLWDDDRGSYNVFISHPEQLKD